MPKLLKATDAITPKCLTTLIYGQPGTGKSEPINSLVATPQGWQTIGSLKIGDNIFGKDGKAQKVTGIYPQGIRPVYEIKTNDGGFCYADEDHLWLVRISSSANSKKAEWRTFTTKKILEKGVRLKPSEARSKSNRKGVLNFELPICSPLEYEKKDLFISPYILGVLIGDGSLGANKCIITNPDQEIVDRVKSELNINYRLSEHNLAEKYCRRFNIVLNKGVKSENEYNKEIKKLGLDTKSIYKFIPKIYKQASIDQRLDLLQGLMDTDGTANKNRVSYSTLSYTLALDIVELVRSLGGIAKIRSYDRKEKGIEFCVNVKINLNPFSLERKAKEWKPSYISRYISEITKVENEECVCIKVSNNDSLYITDDYIVTHNTTLALSSEAPLLLDYDGGAYRAGIRGNSIPIESWQDSLDLLDASKLDDELKEVLAISKTIIIDTIGKLQDFQADSLIKSDYKMANKQGGLSLQGYGGLNSGFKSFLSRLKMMGKDIIIIAHEKEDKDGDTITLRPDIMGGSYGNIMKEIDLCGRLQISNGKRVINFNPTDRSVGKNCAELPLITDPKMNHILAKTKTHIGDINVKQNELLTQINEIRDKLELITTDLELNEIVADIKTIENETVKMQLRTFLTKKVKDLGLSYDTESGLYFKAEATVE